MAAVASRFAILTLLLVGCGQDGPRTHLVKGTVSYQGKPLTLGTVMFVPADGPATAGTINADGTYSLESVPGKQRVSVTAVPPVQGGRPDPSREGGYDYTGATILPSLIPEKFGNYATSGLEVEVQPIAENKIDLELK
jgi:hypothetical protein